MTSSSGKGDIDVVVVGATYKRQDKEFTELALKRWLTLTR